MANNKIITGKLVFSSLKIPVEGKFGKEYKVDLIEFSINDKSAFAESELALLGKAVWESQDGTKHLTIKANSPVQRYNVAGKTRQYDQEANFDLQENPVQVALTFGHSDKFNSDFMRFAGIKFESEPKFWSSDPFAESSEITNISTDDLPF